MVSHLPLKRISSTVQLFRGVSAVRKQLAGAEGRVGYTLLARPSDALQHLVSAQAEN
jgi:hypothetical protein